MGPGGGGAGSMVDWRKKAALACRNPQNWQGGPFGTHQDLPLAPGPAIPLSFSLSPSVHLVPVVFFPSFLRSLPFIPPFPPTPPVPFSAPPQSSSPLSQCLPEVWFGPAWSLIQVRLPGCAGCLLGASCSAWPCPPSGGQA